METRNARPSSRHTCEPTRRASTARGAYGSAALQKPGSFPGRTVEGSGAIEKQMDLAVDRRFQGQGMRWTKKGANRLLKLRIRELEKASPERSRRACPEHSRRGRLTRRVDGVDNRPPQRTPGLPPGCPLRPPARRRPQTPCTRYTSTNTSPVSPKLPAVLGHYCGLALTVPLPL